MPSRWVDYRTVKERVSIRDALEHYGLLAGLSERGDSLVGPCPIHKGDNPTSFRVSLPKNAFHCFSCGAGGNVLDFVAALQSVEVRQAALLLADIFGVESGRSGAHQAQPGPTDEARAPAPALHRRVEEELAANEPLRFTLDKLDGTHPYLAERGFLPETVAAFGIGYHDGKGIMKGRIAIPIHGTAGKLLAYAGRFPGEPPEGEPKYRLPSGFHKSLELFNLCRALGETDETPLAVVEGFFDCMKLWQLGYRRVVAVMGSTLSPAQARLVAEAVGRRGRVTLLFDEDDAGRAGRVEAAALLSPLCYIHACALPREGAQPEHLSAEELADLVP